MGVPALAVLVFEVLLNGTSMFSHGNIRLREGLDRLLRLFVVTPDMHRVHHSVIIRETNSNFGFNFPWWDRFFGTYRPQPAMGHDGMTIGLARFRDAEALTLGSAAASALPAGRDGGPGRRAAGKGRIGGRTAHRAGRVRRVRRRADGNDAPESPPGAQPR